MNRNKEYIHSVQQIDEHLTKNNFFPVYYFFGEDDFLMDEFINTIIQKNIEPSVKSFNLDIVDANSIDSKKLIALVTSYPMNSDKRIVVVKQFNKLLSSEQSIILLRRYIENPLGTTIMILIGDKLDMRTSFAKSLLKSNVYIVEFKALYDNQVVDWIKKRVKVFNKKITDSAANLIAEYVGNSMRDIHNELEKISIYIDQKEIIDENDVNSVVGITKSYNIFALQKAIGERRISEALFIVENMLDRSESAIGIIAMLTKYFQKLWIIRTSNLVSIGIAELFKIPSIFAKEYEKAASNYTVEEIEDAILQLAKTDEKLKSSQINEKLTMTLMIHNIIA